MWGTSPTFPAWLPRHKKKLPGDSVGVNSCEFLREFAVDRALSRSAKTRHDQGERIGAQGQKSSFESGVRSPSPVFVGCYSANLITPSCRPASPQRCEKKRSLSHRVQRELDESLVTPRARARSSMMARRSTVDGAAVTGAPSWRSTSEATS
jgi:hypothetical protein